MSSLNCDRPLHSAIRRLETVISTDGWITNSGKSNALALVTVAAESVMANLPNRYSALC